MSRDDLLHALQHDNVQAFLRVVREGESNQDESAYKTLYGGGHFESFDDHPRIRFPIIYQGAPNYTTAAGAFQIVERTWNEFTSKYGAMPFTPENQTLCAVWRLVYRGALEDVLAGRLDAAIRKCTQEWTSLALAKRQREAPAIFNSYGGRAPNPAAIVVEPTTSIPQEVKPMAPLIPIVLQILANAIPQLASLGFGSGSEVAQRNVAAGTLVAQKLVEVTQSVNLQEAAEKIQNDPAALAAAKQAVADVAFQLSEAGGGGLDGARKANLDPGQQPPWRDKTFLMAVMFYPIIAFVIVGSMLKLPWLAEITAETRAGVIMFVLGTICGGFLTYFTGTTVNSQRKTDALLTNRLT